MQAGLFSAVLTAFVVETYSLLQPDETGTTNQLLAYTLALRPHNFFPPPALNATITALLEAPAFSPATCARWINTLFFVSLVFSLSAALFGILAKQWLREYMHWNSALAAPRDNIMVRQIRIAAWEDWRVPAIISSIPVLLRLAVILFLVGLVILLWTLDNVVAIAVSVATGLSLAAAGAFTFLPIIFARCPYKSPTARASFRLFHLLRSATHRILSYLPGRHSPPVDDGASYSSWRSRDLSAWAAKRLSIRNDTQKILIGLTLRYAALYDFRAIDVDDVTKELSESCLLSSALEWVYQASQDTRTTMYINQCATDGLQELSAVPTSEYQVGPYTARTITALVHRWMLWSIVSSHPSNTPEAVRTAQTASLTPDFVVKSILRDESGYTQWSYDAQQVSSVQLSQLPPHRRQLASLLECTTSSSIIREINSCLDSFSPGTSGKEVAFRIRTLYGLVEQLKSNENRSMSSALHQILAHEPLTKAMHSFESAEAYAHCPTRYYATIFVRGCSSLSIRWDPEEEALGASECLVLRIIWRQCLTFSFQDISDDLDGTGTREYLSLLRGLRYTLEAKNVLGIYLLVFISTQWLRCITAPEDRAPSLARRSARESSELQRCLQEDEIGSLEEACDVMTEVAQAVLQKNRSRVFANHGIDTHTDSNADDAAWTDTIQRISSRVYSDTGVTPAARQSYRRLVHTLEACYRAGVLSGDRHDIGKNLRSVLAALHAHAYSACDWDRCRWASDRHHGGHGNSLPLSPAEPVPPQSSELPNTADEPVLQPHLSM